MGADEPYVELRGDVLREHIDVIDAVAHATPGASRSSVVRQIIAAWVEAEIHRSTVVLRVARHNGIVAESNRTGAGKVTP